MNLILTSACNKQCSFCFAKPYVTNPEKELLPLDKAKSIVDQLMAIGERISLLGGEPTIYPDFVPLMDYIIEKYTEGARPESALLLVSNFLFTDTEVGDVIAKALQKKLPLRFLLNAAEMTKSQLEIFNHNLVTYVKPFSEDGQVISPGITLSKKMKSSYYINILSQINDEFKLESIRASVPNPMRGSVDFSDYKDNEMPIYRRQLRDIIDWGIAHQIKVSFDCGITECLFEEPLPRKFIDQWVPMNRRSGCASTALDLKPDGTLIPCYPGDFIEDNMSNHFSELKPLISKIQAKKRRYISEAKRPEVCLSCKHFKITCDGPCIGFYNEGEN